MEWTFDPLEIKNSYFNLERLGAIARRYNINQYGITSSPLQGFLPTDRLVAEWWLKSKRVEISAVDRAHRRDFRRSCTSRFRPRFTRGRLRRRHGRRRPRCRLRNREQFMKAFADGLSCLGYGRDDQGDGAFLLGRWDEDWSFAMKA